MKITSAPNWRLRGWFALWGRRLGVLPAKDLLQGCQGPVPRTPCELRSPRQAYDLLSPRQLDKNVVTLIWVLIEFPEINPGLLQGLLLALGTTCELVAVNNAIIFVCTGVSVPNPLIQQLTLGACSGWEAALVPTLLGCGRARGSGPSDP